MKTPTNLRWFLPSTCALSLVTPVLGQYTPPPPLQPFPGFLNEALRAKDPYYANWDLSGSVRLRYEARENALMAPPPNDFKAGVDNDNSFVADKVLLRMGYTAKWWNVLVEGRSSSVTGDERGSAPNIPTGASPESDGVVELHQANFTIGNHKEFPLSVKVGRQELIYGDERLIGAGAWSNIGRVFDAAKLRWQNAWFGVDAFVSRVVVPDDNEFNMGNEYDHLSGLYFNTKQIPKHWTEFYVLAHNVSPKAAQLFAPDTTPAPYNLNAQDTYTIGARFRSGTNEFGNFDYTAEVAGQFGNWKRAANVSRPGERDETQAFAVAVNAGYTLAEAWGKPRFALEYAFASGDSNPNDDVHETFDNLYPTNHKFYGYMDAAAWQNVHDIRPMVAVKPHARVSLALEGHLFWLADTHDRFYNAAGIPRAGAGAAGAPLSGTGYGLNPTYSSFVGSELDAIAGFALTRYANMEFGYGHFFHGDYVSQTFSITGSQDADWIYAQLLVRF